MADKATKASAGQLRMIYGLARKAGMTDDVLHARCQAETGQEHLSQLSISQAGRLIDSLQGKRGGYIPAPDSRPLDRASQAQINIILGIARKMGWLPKGNKTRLNAFIRARVGVERLDWLTPEQAIKTTEALKAMLAGGRAEREGYRGDNGQGVGRTDPEDHAGSADG